MFHFSTDRRSAAFALWLTALVAAAAPAEAQNGTTDADELSSQATDPTASLMAFNLVTKYVTGFHGPDVAGQPDDRTEISFRPVIPFRAFDLSNIMRLTIRGQVDGRGDEELKDVTLFNLTVFDAPWGRWGVGPVATFAATDDAPDDAAVGPAIGGVWSVSPKLKLGAFNQNVFAGDTSISQLQPIAAYQLGNGWSLSLGDLQIVYDWKEDEFVGVPIGAQLGKVLPIAGQPMRFAINPQYNLRDKDGTEDLSFLATVTLLVPSP